VHWDGYVGIETLGHERQLEGRRSATKSEENTTGKPAAQLHEPATLALLAAAVKGVCVH
jgi:hypothetical protein